MSYTVIRIELDGRRVPVGRYLGLRAAQARAAALNRLPERIRLGATYQVAEDTERER